MPDAKTAIVMPCYRVSRHVKDVIESIPDSIDHIIVVDDACPENSGKAAESVGRGNVTVVYHARNTGVGGAVVTGYRKAMELGCDIMVKMDGDGQMDPDYLGPLMEPVIQDGADYTKGNRFKDFKRLKTMPATRLFGNSALSFLVKLASGYWNVMDPTNGFTAIHRRVLGELNLEKISRRFFFESDMLINLRLVNAVVQDVDMPARYGAEGSTLNVWKALLQFPLRLFQGFLRRMTLQYFIYDFNMASVYMLLGIPLFLFGVIYGAANWVAHYRAGEPTPLGTIMLAALPIILALEMLLQAVNIDINSVPKKR
jgi:glycosyltransferase involved in cell wall biosynthesis